MGETYLQLETKTKYDPYFACVQKKSGDWVHNYCSGCGTYNTLLLRENGLVCKKCETSEKGLE